MGTPVHPLHVRGRQNIGRTSFWRNVAMFTSASTCSMKPSGQSDLDGHYSDESSAACSPFPFLLSRTNISADQEMHSSEVMELCYGGAVLEDGWHIGDVGLPQGATLSIRIR